MCRLVEALDVVADQADLPLVFEDAAYVLHSDRPAADVATESACHYVLVDPKFFKNINKISVVNGIESDLAYAFCLKLLHGYKSLRIYKLDALAWKPHG